MERIDHTKCTHESTPKGRKACRKALRSAAELADRVGAAQAQHDFPWLETPAVQAAIAKEEATPFVGRAIKLNFKMKDGERYSVVFDRYGLNSELFVEASKNGWNAERTVAQAISNAIHAVGSQYGFDNIATYDVHTVA